MDTQKLKLYQVQTISNVTYTFHIIALSKPQAIKIICKEYVQDNVQEIRISLVCDLDNIINLK
ncbi:hypothetical protein [Corallibacter sp.]|uniref:hypothetical protein n=1 Tax=Corallibacter sp. TaxID=2038084 RepID=UPI003A916288